MTTTETAGESTTSGAGEESTTTVEVGAGTLEPGQETSTTGDPGEETTTTGDDVAGGSESTLPYTGAGDMTMGGLAGLLVSAPEGAGGRRTLRGYVHLSVCYDPRYHPPRMNPVGPGGRRGSGSAGRPAAPPRWRGSEAASGVVHIRRS